MCVVLDVVINHGGPVHAASDVHRMSPFNQLEHYHTYLRRPGQSFDAYARRPANVFDGFAPGCGPGDYNCTGYSEELVEK
jgi:hypothetical protein